MKRQVFFADRIYVATDKDVAAWEGKFRGVDVETILRQPHFSFIQVKTANKARKAIEQVLLASAPR